MPQASAELSAHRRAALSLISAWPEKFFASAISSLLRNAGVAFELDDHAIALVAAFDIAHLAAQVLPRPLLIRQMDSQSFSTWSMRWVENRMALPWSLKFEQAFARPELR